MSTFAVKVVRISEIKPHPNADALELAMIEDSLWQTVTAKGKYHVGDLAIYVPVEALLPVEVSDAWGVTQYLSKQRVRAARLRGEMSYGFLADPEGFALGDDLTEHFGIVKYEPVLHCNMCDSQKPSIELPNFPKYTDIENIRNHANVFVAGEPVVVTEKIHGTNSRVGLILNEDGEPVFVCGSHRYRRELGDGGIYEMPLGIQEVKDFLLESGPDTVIYGEIFGCGIQKGFHYGCPTHPTFRAFDVWQNGKYMNAGYFFGICESWGIPHVPIVAECEFDFDYIKSLTNGKSTLDDGTTREGVVIKPVEERFHRNVGRVVLKLIGDDYLLNKNSS
jgi:RNA ligase (TIGR02306 family)